MIMSRKGPSHSHFITEKDFPAIVSSQIDKLYEGSGTMTTTIEHERFFTTATEDERFLGKVE